jgi:hypothetical protein
VLYAFEQSIVLCSRAIRPQVHWPPASLNTACDPGLAPPGCHTRSSSTTFKISRHSLARRVALAQVERAPQHIFIRCSLSSINSLQPRPPIHVRVLANRINVTAQHSSK